MTCKTKPEGPNATTREQTPVGQQRVISKDGIGLGTPEEQ
jgi:hypothetical protein